MRAEKRTACENTPVRTGWVERSEENKASVKSQRGQWENMIRNAPTDRM